MDLDFHRARRQMVEEQLIPRGIAEPRVLAAMGKVERHRFMPAAHLANAYADGAFPLPHGQTISQPYIVALMSQMLKLQPGQRVLEIGTGCGYQTAVLAELGGEIYSMEQNAELAAGARALLEELGYRHVHVTCGNGWAGWPEHAPYDRIIVTCAPPSVPEALIRQLAPGGRIILPLGEAGAVQTLYGILKDRDGVLTRRRGINVRFVPMLEKTGT